MHDLLPFILIGITSGSVYGLAGIGLVLTYKASGIFNFGHGAIAALSVFVFYWLHVQHGMPWPLAAAICVLILGPILGVGMELIWRTLGRAAIALKVSATVGLVLIVVAVCNIWYANVSAPIPTFLPTNTIDVGGLNVGWDQITVVLVVLISTIALFFFFRFARLGMAMRAVVDDADLIGMTGTSPRRVRRWAWVIGASFAAMSGLLLAPSLSLDALLITELIVQAFGAAAIGAFTSLPMTYVGGLAIGIAGSLSTKYVTQIPSLSGLPAGLPFIVLFIVLLVLPRARLAQRSYVPSVRLPEAWYAPDRVRIVFGTGFVILLCFVPMLVGTKLPVYATALADSILFLSLGLLVRASGQVSLCQYGFAAVGAAAFTHFSHSLGIPWLLAMLFAGLLAIPLGAILAVPAIRLSGIFLALATFGFGILLEQMFYTMNFMFGSSTEGVPAPRPHVDILGWHTDSSSGFYYVILVFAVVFALASVALLRGRLGRLLRALSDSPTALETYGTTVNMTRLLVFCLSSFMAAIAGGLIASELNFAIGTEFSSFSSLTIVVVVVVIQAGNPWYAVLCAAAIQIVPAYISSANIANYLNIIFGLSAAVAAYTIPRAPGVPRALRALAGRLDSLLRFRPTVFGPGQAGLPAPAAQSGAIDVEAGQSSRTKRRDARRPGLEVDGILVRFGGVIAVRDLSLTAPQGSVTGLIGPNGAGKTTTFNAVSGLRRPASGSIRLHGEDVSRLAPSARARRGLGRTFQRVDLFNSLTARANVELGCEASMAGRSPFSQVAARAGQPAQIQQAAQRAIVLTGIEAFANTVVSELTSGQRRLVELARVLAGDFDMILLDEPSSGLDVAETRRFGDIIRRVVAERGVGILLVEHDMALVRQICDRVYVLDFGVLIFEGSPAEMAASQTVRAAYLGADISDSLPHEDLSPSLAPPPVA